MSERDTQRQAFSGDIKYEREESPESVRAPRRRFRMGKLLWLCAGACILIAVFFLSGSVRGATITVTAKKAPLSLNADFNAGRLGEGLTFTAIPLSATGEEVVPAETLKKVSERASGTLTIYNNYSKEDQRLIKNTRFESPKGLMYRIDKSIVIPGRTLRDGKVIPGSIEALVFADSPGEEYNSGQTDFTIPGFKNDASRYSALYARSKTALSGGIDGTIRTPSDSVQAAAESKLREKLQTELRQKAQEAAGSDKVLYDNALVIKFEPLPLETRSDDKAAVRVSATAVAYLFDRDTLEQAAAEKGVRTYNGLPVEVPELDTFSFAFLPPLPSATTAMTEIKFKLQGEGNAIWVYEKEELKTALLGKARDDLASTISAFPTIEKIDVAIRPFWSRRLPDNPKKIEVKEAAASTDQ
ncbi:MAG: hypothetical protein Q7R88_01925 [bacterium]|nr:hypothetical protein [bacterium]